MGGEFTREVVVQVNLSLEMASGEEGGTKEQQKIDKENGGGLGFSRKNTRSSGGHEVAITLLR